MFNKENFEKRFLKSILKDHVRVTTENIVKLLINGVTGLFKPRLPSKLVLITALIGLTACGGGGGGSSSATPTSSPKIIKISEGEKLVISETISVDNTSSNIVAVESKGDLELSSNIDMESENSVAINVKSGGSVVIGEDAVVTVSGDNSKAILVEGNSSATTIKSIGAEVETSATNLGEITISGSNSVGIEASGISTEIENTGKIGINGEVSSGMVVKDGAIASNAGTISGTGDEAAGIKAIGTESFATNSSTGTITVDGNLGYGMASEDSASIINEGTVAINGLNGYGMYSKSGSKGTNKGTINTAGDNSSGMYSSESGTTIVNDEVINVSGKSSIGMESLDGATAVNNNEINLNGISETGISGSNGSLISNAGTISGTGELITGVSILNSSFLNEGNIIVTGDGEVTADIASTVVSKGAIGVKSSGTESMATNSETGTITVDGKISYGMIAEDGASIINEGNIVGNGIGGHLPEFDSEEDDYNGWYKGTTAMYSSGDGATSENTGSIVVNGIESYGMVTMDGSVGINKGTIETNGNGVDNWGEYDPLADTTGGVGMYTRDGSITNEGTINSNGSWSKGMYAKGNGTATNTETININGDGSIGMYSRESEATVINNGEINVSGNNGRGMRARDGATAINNEEINIIGNYGSGMFVSDGATVVNNGVISVSLDEVVRQEDSENETTSRVFGMNGTSDSTIENNGEIGVTAILEKSDIDLFGIRANEMSDLNNTGDVVVYASNTGMNKWIETYEGEEGTFEYDAWSGVADATGIEAYDTSNVENSGNISVSAEGIDSITESARGINIQNYTSDSDNYVRLNGSNSGIINVSAIGTSNNDPIEYPTNSTYADGIVIDGGVSFTNTETGEIIVTAANSTGTAVAYGVISTGAAEESSSFKNYGKIVVSGDEAHGMMAGYSGSTVENYGTVSFDSDNGYGMEATDGAIAINEGDIIGTGDGEVTADIASTVVSKGAIGVRANGTESMATNSETGTITVDGKISYGMIAEDGASIINEGNIVGNGIGGHLPEFDSEEDDYNGWYKGTTAMYSSGDGATSENTGSIVVNGIESYGMVTMDGSVGINKGTIETNGNGVDNWGEYDPLADTTGGVGMYTRDGSITNEGTINSNGSWSKGMYAKGNGTATNTETININGDGSIGMYSRESEATVINNGEINVSGNNGRGMRARDGATAINNEEINIIGNYGSGMFVSDGATVVNNGVISVSLDEVVRQEDSENETTSRVFGMNGTSDSTIENNGEIGVTAILEKSDIDLFGIRANEMSDLNNTGDVVVYASNTGMNKWIETYEGEEGTFEYDAWSGVADATGIEAYDTSNVENSGNISVSAEGIDSITESARGINIQNYTSDSDNYVRLNGSNSGIINVSAIGTSNNDPIEYPTNSTYADGIVIDGGVSFTNTETGEIIVTAANSTGTAVAYGVISTGAAEESSSFKNYGKIVVSGDEAHGMMAGYSGSTVENYGTVSFDSDNGYGMEATDGAIAINEGDIIGTGDGEVTADIASTVVSKGAIGVRANGTESMATNSETGTITVDGKISYGMIAEDGASIINEGNIVGNGIGGHLPEFDSEEDDYNGWYKGTTAMYSSGDGATSENTGSIVVNGIESYGMVTMDGSVGINKGTIETNGNGVDNWGEYDPLADTTGGVGMYTRDGSITNEGTINSNGSWSKGMYAKGNGTATNTETININGDGSIGMYSRESEATVINNGEINVSGNNGRGMRARDGATAINNEEINIIGNYGSGMFVSDGATVINNGTINATLNKSIEQEDPENETTSSIFGMYGTEDSVIENNGDITVIGKDTEDYNRSFGINANVTASVTNTGDIYVSSIQSNVLGEGSANSAGINLDNVGEFLNSGSVTAYAEAVNDSPEAVGLDINNWDYQGISNAINSGSIEVSVLGKYVYSGLEEHYNYVDAEGVSLYGEGINFTTSEGGEIKVSAAGEKSSVEAVGIDADTISTLKNLGEIVVTSTNDGYKTIIGEYDDGNGNLISYENTQGSANATGINMYNVSNFENTGTINSTAENSTEGSDSGESKAVGIYAGSYFSDEESPVSLTGINSGKINVSATGSYGGVQTEDIYGDYTWARGLILDVSGSFINSESGEITVNATDDNQTADAQGVYLNNWNTSGNLSFENRGIITVTGDITHGVTASGSNVTTSNYGEISIYGNSGYGMGAYNGATAINADTGTINLMGSNGVGMYATGSGSTIENRGTIYLSGSQVASSDNYQTDWETTETAIVNGMDNKGNMGMKIENGAKMINKGKIVFGN